MSFDLPETIADVAALEELLSRPTPAVIELLRRLAGDVLLLGVAGKIGPSLARMARRASEAAGRPRRIIGVARFSSPSGRDELEAAGIETIACDLMDRAALARLPDAANILYLAGMKFGSSGQQAATWARNTYLPGLICERFPASRIVAYSTGNVYPFTPHDRGGSVETDLPAPVGEYAQSCLGRERMFQYFSETQGTAMALLRLNYAHEMRYGVMVDVAAKVCAGEPVDVTMGYFNALWQGDNNAMTLLALEQAAAPATIINLAGPQTLAVRAVAEEFGRLLGRTVALRGGEAPDALLSNAAKSYRLFGPPTVSETRLMRWIADWQRRGGPTLNKPTHFEVRDGAF